MLRQNNKYIKSLFELTEQDKRDFGAKAVNLGIIRRAGIRVPEGFCISQCLYDRVIQPDGNIKFPPEVLKDLKIVYEKLNGDPVAVRSSSSMEDSENYSFAGLYDTFLNVTNFDDMISSIEKCMSSVNAERVQKYIKENVIEKKENRMAIIIQKMINSKVSGVLFMANPLNNRYDQIMINGSWGLGEAIVNGEVSPDQWIVDKSTGEIESEKINNKTHMTRKENNGVSLQDIQQDLMLEASLNHEQIVKLVELSKKVQVLYKNPQDIEWAFDGDNFFIVQSRDITTLYPMDEDILSRKKLSVFLCFNTVVQGIIEPFTPLGYEFWRATFAGYTSIYYNKKRKDLYPKWIKMINGRLYYDLTEMVGKKFYAKLLPNNFDSKDPGAATLLRQIITKYGSVFCNQGGSFKLSFGILKWGMSLGKYAKKGKNPNIEQAVKEALQLGEDFITYVSSRIEQAKTIENKIKLIEDIAEESLLFAFKQAMYCSYGLKAVEEQDAWIKKHYNGQFDLESIRKVLPNNPTTTMSIELSRVAKKLSEAGIVATKNEPLVIEFLKKYGHRGDIEIDLGTKHWSEDTSYIIKLINSYIEGNRAVENLERIEKINQKAIETIEAIYQKVFEDKGRGKAEVIKYDYMNFRMLAGLRERPKFDVIRVMGLLRNMMLDIGNKLQKENVLEYAEDIAFLTFKQLQYSDPKEFMMMVRKAKEEYKQHLQFKHIPRFVLSTGECLYHPVDDNHKAKTAEDTCLKGTPISKGSYKGRVRVLHTPVDVDLLKGDIIVTHNTNPSWTPLFLVAGALIMESGGPMAHGAIVAREFGIPAVAGIGNATQLLKDGEIVLVNGVEGTVRRCTD